MSLLGAAAIGAAGSIAGGLLGSSGQKSANAANRRLAREQMQFQERMSNTAHQRQVKDLRAAGINPILSAKLGGASSPAGQTANMQNESAAIASGVSNATSAAVGTRNVMAQTQQTQNSARMIELKADQEEFAAWKARLTMDAVNATDAATRKAAQGVLNDPRFKNFIYDGIETVQGIPETVSQGIDKFQSNAQKHWDTFNKDLEDYLRQTQQKLKVGKAYRRN